MFIQALTAAVVSALAILTTGATANKDGSIVSRLGNQPSVKMADRYVPARTKTEMAVRDALERVKVDKETKLNSVYYLKSTIIDSGSCGADVRYTLDSDGILTISGVGLMANFFPVITPVPWIRYASMINKIIIEDGVMSIGRYAFANHNGLTSIGPKGSGASVEIPPNSVRAIDNYAFANCKNLTSVIIPKGVYWIENYAFADCISLTSVTIPEGVTSIGEGAFSSCESLTSVTIPESVTSIVEGAFVDCKNLTSVIIPKGVYWIDGYAFAGCISLTSVTIPEGVTLIGYRAFADCNSLNEVEYCGLTSPQCEPDVFKWCGKLTAVKTPKGYRGSVFCGMPVEPVNDICKDMSDSSSSDSSSSDSSSSDSSSSDSSSSDSSSSDSSSSDSSSSDSSSSDSSSSDASSSDASNKAVISAVPVALGVLAAAIV